MSNEMNKYSSLKKYQTTTEYDGKAMRLIVKQICHISFIHI
jgi:hypothetical protein